MNTTTQLTFQSNSITDTVTLGEAIGALLRRGDTVLLAGDLGAGKTHLSKGIVAGTGSTNLVTSPTFVFINEYRTSTQLIVFHVDFVRLNFFQECFNKTGGQNQTLNSFHLLFSPFMQENGALLDEKTFRGKYYNQYCGASKAG